MFILFLLCAFKSGSDRFYLKKAEGLSGTGKEVFYYFYPKNALSLLAFYLNLYTRKLMLFIICFAPSVAVTFFLMQRIVEKGFSLYASVVLLLASAMLFFNGLYYFIRLNGFFFLARYYFASGKYFSYRQLFSFCGKLIKNKKAAVLKKRLSFIPWFVLCIFLLPVSLVRSHYNLSMAQLAHDLMEL